MPTISVIVPVYKVEPYLCRCVDSILAQTFTDFELILVDDGSPDGCPAICDEYQEKDSRVVVIHQQNGGLSAARNAGIDWAFANSDSEWLTFIDSDDFVSENYLELLLHAAVENDAEISMGCFTSVQNDDPVYFPERHGMLQVFDHRPICSLLYNDKLHWSDLRYRMCSIVSAWGKLYKKSLFSECRFPEGRIHEDQGTTYKLLFRARKTVLIGDVIYFYRLNDESIMHRKFNIKRYDDLDLLKEAIMFFAEMNEDEIKSLAEKHYMQLKLQYAIEARQAGIYREVPKEYRTGSFLKTTHEIEKYSGEYAKQDAWKKCYPHLYRGYLHVDAALKMYQSKGLKGIIERLRG